MSLNVVFDIHSQNRVYKLEIKEIYYNVYNSSITLCASERCYYINVFDYLVDRFHVQSKS
jgi:hypothetical protein